MKRKIIIAILIILVILGVFFIYYELNNEPVLENQQQTIIQEDQTDQEKVVSFFEALEESNYQELSKDFTSQLAFELSEEEMPKLRKMLFDNLGELINLKEPEVGKGKEDDVVLVYSADFEKETNVMIKATFTKDGKLAAIYLDSPKLREATGKY